MKAEIDEEIWLDGLELATVMDIGQSPFERHWTDDAGDPRREAARRQLQRELGEKMGWECAEPVGRWRIWLLTQKQLADKLHVSARQLQNLERRGLPSEGDRGSWRAPWPDVWAWWLAYQCAIARRKDPTVPIAHIDPDFARMAFLEDTLRDWKASEQYEPRRPRRA